MKKLLLSIAIVISAAILTAQSITNISPAQRTDGSMIVDITYDLSGPEPGYTITAEASFDEGANFTQISALTGDIGAGITPGTGKTIEWNFGSEFPGQYSATTQIRLTASLVLPWNCGEPFTDSRDSQSYTTVQIGSQCWMSENLNIGTMINGSSSQTNNSTIEKYCYSNNTANCDAYGGLYQWNEMMQYSTTPGIQGICPEGWHLPTDAEWTQLTYFLINTYVDITSDNVGNKLKSCRQVNSPVGGDCNTSDHPRWNSNATHYGTNDFGFSSLPGGSYIGGSYYVQGNNGYWWSSTENGSSGAWYRGMYYNYGGVDRSSNNKTNGFSVRCVRD